MLCLVWLRARSVWAHRVAIVAAALSFGTHPMFLFVLGHLTPPSALPRSGGGSGRGRLGMLLLLLGLALNFSVIMSKQAAQITRLAQERAIERAREQGAREALEGQLDGTAADAPADPAAKSPQA